MARAQWGSRFGFILAAAGSAVGLGNIWGFPYQVGQNGGGWFVLVYLLCVIFICLPIMMAEVMIGRSGQSSPVGAIRNVAGGRTFFQSGGFMGVLAAFMILSFYSVVAGWSLHFVWLSVTDGFAGKSADELNGLFGALATNEEVSTMWHVIFMVMTIGIVAAGVKGGIELCAKILMPALFLILLVLLVWAIFSDGFSAGWKYMVGSQDEELLSKLKDPPKFTPQSCLAALGQAFFSLSLGMGALITYGSYLKSDEDIVSTSIIITILDTSVALLAAFIIFPIVFSVPGLEPTEGPGLVFATLPNAFAQMPGGLILAPIFFLLLAFAAITSAISLLEVAASYFIDEKGWSRAKATLFCGGLIALLGVPSALAGGSKLFGSEFDAMMKSIFTSYDKGLNWFDTVYFATFNIMLPLGGLIIALFVSWRVGNVAREEAFKAGTKLGQLYWAWLLLLRFIVPIAVIAVLLYSMGILNPLFEESTKEEATSLLWMMSPYV